MSPQEKKKHSLQKDCRNTFGENDKSSRKSIRMRKRWVRRTFRRQAQQQLMRQDRGPEDVEARLLGTRRKNWMKAPDMPVGAFLQQNANWTLATTISSLSSKDPNFIPWLKAELQKAGMHQMEVKQVIKIVQALSLPSCSTTIAFPLETCRVLVNLLRKRQQNA